MSCIIIGIVQCISVVLAVLPWESVIVLCFAVRYFMSILVMQSS